MQIDHLNDLSQEQLLDALERCCGSTRWLNAMLAKRPFINVDHLLEVSDEVAVRLTREDWLEAFSHHPEIGDIGGLREKFANTSRWAAGEQSGVSTANDEVLQDLAKGNKQYKEKFGYIFIVCASGKTAEEMLAILQSRLQHDAEHEILIAATEQNKITKIRLEKLCQEAQ